MALQKQSVPINFSKGLNTKSDPKQVQLGNFLALSNSVFSTEGELKKRNGYGALTALPDSTYDYLTTFSGNLTAIGPSLAAYSQSSESWVNKGHIQPLKLSTLSLIRSNTNQSQADTAISASGLVCTVYTDNVTSGGSTVAQYKYAIANVDTGQNIVAPTAITPSAGVVSGAPRVFLLGRYFVIVFTVTITATNHLQYIAISTANPTSATAAADISSNYTAASTVAFDGYVLNNNLYLAWNGADGGGAIRVSYLDSTLVQHSTVTFAGKVATHISVSADTSGTTGVVYVSIYDSGSQNGYILAVNQQLTTVLAPTLFVAGTAIVNLASAAQSGSVEVYYEITSAYSYDSSIATNYIKSRTCSQAGVLGTAAVVVRSVGLASKAFIVNTTPYFLTIYKSSFQPTYFLVNSSGQVAAKLAYQNGSTYYVTGLPSVVTYDGMYMTPYLVKDLIQAVNKTQGAANAAGVFSQTGINLVKLDIGTSDIVSSEIGNNLNISGGFMWAYDGYVPVEQGFHLWPDSVEATWSATGGSIHAQPDSATNTNAYFYQVTYEWSDNQGNIFRSAPSVPTPVTTTSNGTTGSITVNVPTLRLTYKTANPVKIVIYRWSVGQQIYYQTTSITVPVLNNTTVDSIAYVDTLADASILGNNIIYTTGGVLENIGPPATDVMTLCQSRLFLLDSEDKNLLWFSKQVIESTPVEMSDLLTIFVPPTTGAQGSTGDITALSCMDDKVIIFKRDAIYYISGSGPDNTGANNQFSDPVFITATVGCIDQHSIVFMPNGLMFQSDKGIWLLGRDISTTYIGAPVEAFTNTGVVQSAVNVPGTNEVRFTLDSGVTLMYDYFYGQWGTFMGAPARSSTLYQSLHTYINDLGGAYQETPGEYLDGSQPVTMSFTTSWINVMGLQGYERAYFFYLLGTYLSPHRLQVSIAYDYNESATQSTMITPDNYGGTWGSESVWGGGAPWGGPGNVEQWRVFLQQQKCQAFRITVKEVFDPSYSTAAGPGLTMSGLNLVIGGKSGYPRLRPSRSVG